MALESLTRPVVELGRHQHLDADGAGGILLVRLVDDRELTGADLVVLSPGVPSESAEETRRQTIFSRVLMLDRRGASIIGRDIDRKY